MNNKILLALLPPWGDNGFPPLGIPCISSYMIKNGYNVIKKDYVADIYSKIIQNFIKIFSNPSNYLYENNYNKMIYPLLIHFLKKWVDEIIESDASIIGFTAYSTNMYTIKNISKMIKAKDPDKIIVIGGPETNRVHEYITWECIDYSVIGDGEDTFLQLVEALRNSKTDVRSIKGLFYKNKRNNEIVNTGDNTIVRLDDLPFPDFNNIDFQKYKWSAIPIEFSRGCINKCSFCVDILLKNKYRFKSGKRVFEEIMHFVNLGHTYFAFMDSLLNGNMKELENFCDLIIENGINNGENKITWEANVCIRKEMTFELLDKMKKAGCNCLHYGVESGSDDVLKIMNKKTTVSLINEVLKNTYLAGIKVNIYMLLGFPTETEDNFKETLNFIETNKKYINYIYAGEGCVIFLNSDLYKNPEKYGIYWKTEEHKNNKDGHNWYSKETSLEIRRERVKIFVEHCNALKINSENQL